MYYVKCIGLYVTIALLVPRVIDGVCERRGVAMWREALLGAPVCLLVGRCRKSETSPANGFFRTLSDIRQQYCLAPASCKSA